MLTRLPSKVILICGLSVAIVASGLAYLHAGKIHPYTNDAYVQANIVNIAAQVSGPVSAIYVQDHETVKKGQLLFAILPARYRAALAKAIAQQDLAEKNAQRIASLVDAHHAAQSAGDEAEANLLAAQADLDLAKLDLKFTQVTAPADGVLVNFNLRVGSSVSPETALFSLIETDRWWINANYKETQLAVIRPGQPAVIKIDLYPSKLFKGTVEQISDGSGAAFSLLPFENATGNWIKVTQRFPVKIRIENIDPRYPLRVGASASVTVDTEK